MDKQVVIKKLHAFVAQQILENESEKLDEQTPLLAWGILDSLAMVRVLSFLETDLGVEVPDDEVRPEHFENLSSLSELVVRLSQPAA